jgi:Ca2+-binding EF-hand superfamily protein
VARYGNSLKTARELPPFVLEIKPPAGVVLAADYQYNSIYELEGDIQALRLIDLDREGLSEYRSLVQRLAVGAPVAQQQHQQQQLDSSIVTSLNANSNATSAIPSALTSAVAAATSVLPPATPVYSEIGSVSTTPNQQHLSNQNSQLVYEVFNALDRDHNGQLTVDEAERLLLRLNSRLGRRYGEDDVKRFFEAIDLNKDGKIEVSEFRRVFESRHL